MHKRSSDCIFCDIVAHEKPSTVIFETDLTFVIKNIFPQAPLHYLLLTKTHLTDMREITAATADHIKDFGLCIVRLCNENIAAEAGFNIISNNGVTAGQSIPHLHWHFVSGKNLYTSDGLKL